MISVSDIFERTPIEICEPVPGHYLAECRYCDHSQGIDQESRIVIGLHGHYKKTWLSPQLHHLDCWWTRAYVFYCALRGVDQITVCDLDKMSDLVLWFGDGDIPSEEFVDFWLRNRVHGHNPSKPLPW